MDFLKNSFVFLSLLPFFPFLLVYFIHYRWKHNRKASLKLAMDVTTLFLIISVSALFNLTFGSRFGFYLILLLLLISVGLVGSAQNRLKGRIDIQKMAKLIWRMSFVVMSFSYLLFTIFGILKYIFITMS
ncbi:MULTISPECIES: DUF3397 domain-containing protein [Paenibacillus]|uniref:DUF3397 domain-containing protein n=1 Tax=Paenibacillus albilobatus TaxID=2716884 RepID=A0A919XHM3_9BACL|nr:MULTISPECIES: DUF3397 domain-containing protein [Paenibacillus]GIO30528.1 hypothetical protein J2TS6_16690 [Paenibacillus albilobatus]